MSPRKGVRRRPIIATSMRQKMWQSMRIMKRFSIPDVLRTVDGSTYTNACKFFCRLEKAGIIGKAGRYVSGRSGEYQGYVLLKDMGPVMPILGYGRNNDNGIEARHER